MQTLRAEIKSAQAALRHRRALKLTILLGTLLHVSGQPRLALRTIRGAVQIAAGEGMIRTFLDEGEPVLNLLREFRVARKRSPDMGQGGELDTFIERILAKGDATSVSPLPDDSLVAALATLTSRELQILESLSLGLTDIAIAKNLFVAETTVRTHLRRIYVKLGAGNRLQAVGMGRRLGLIK